MVQIHRIFLLILLPCGLFTALISPSNAWGQESARHDKPAAETDNPASVGASPSMIGRWAVSINKTDKGEPQVEIRLSANEPYTAEDGSDLNTADLVIGCTPGNTVAFVDWKGPLINEDNDISIMNISYALDSGHPTNSNWEISSLKTSLISENSVDFIKSLNGRRRLEMQLMPDGLKQETIVFSLANLDDVLKVIGAQCYK